MPLYTGVLSSASSPVCLACLLPLPRPEGVTSARCLLLGANTPWNRVRLTRGLGTRGPVRIIACIEDPVVIRLILEHLRSRETTDSQARLPPERAPPQIGLFDE